VFFRKEFFLRVFIGLLILAAPALADPYADLLSRGVPARSASVEDGVFLVEISGSLSQGDSLLKHYGGTFFLMLDSISAGWPLTGLEVHIPGSALIIFPEDVMEAMSLLGRGAGDEALASWVLEHTWVVDSAEP
jgi:hypothetical protein